MKNLLNPKWLILINTFPVAILCILYYNEYTVIKTLLEKESITLWINFGSTLVALSVVLLGYVFFCIQQKKEISVFYGLSALVIYTIFLYTYSEYSNDIIPWNIPRWMISQDSILYPGTFLMPTLIHALFVIVLQLTSKVKQHKAWKSFLMALAIPLLTYIFAQVVLPLWQPVNYRYEHHALVILCVIAVIVFLFFLIRGIYILSLKKGKERKILYLITKLIVGVVLPIIGLSVNSGFGNVFGNFNHYWFYVIAIINGVLIGISAIKNERHRLVLFIARCITFSFTFYFFLVFLPYLPLSVIAIIAIGSGFLMLTPLALFVIYVQELSKDYKYLKSFYKKPILIAAAIAGFLVIPSAVTLNYLNDRQVLHNALDFVYAPNYENTYSINKTSLKHTLQTVKSTKSRRGDLFMSSQTPYLSSFFHWLVLDNLTLSDAKIKTIDKIFFKAEGFALRQERLRNKAVNISNISCNSTYDETNATWTSWIDIEITNSNTSNFTSEYATTINLPDGCWINDYYLYVGDKKEMGILAEKKSAMWIFSEIRNINRDPGLLHYTTGNDVSFRVFPFAKNEVRKTGIQFIHKDPVNIEIDGHELLLGDTLEISKPVSNDGNIVYISSEEKTKLATVKRKPYYHFIVDTSKDKDSLQNNYIATINTFISNRNLDIKDAKISFTNTFTTTKSFDTSWSENLKNQNYEGGFYLERGIKKILFDSYINLSDSYPVIIVVTDNMLDAIIEKDFANFKIAYPESNLFYHLNTLGRLASHDLKCRPKEFVNDDVSINLNNEVLVWPNENQPLAYLPKTSQPSVTLKQALFELDDSNLNSNWNTGLQLQGKWISDTFYPENAEKDWITSVQQSFKSKIMTPLTSYIVVETEAQKAALLRKQEQVLNGKKSLDLNERSQRMSEPSLFILIILLGVFVLIKRKKLNLL